MGGEGYRVTVTRYRVYPNATAEKVMYATLESCRLLYNRLLEDCMTDAMEGILQKSLFDLHMEVTKVANSDPALKRTVYCTVLRDVGSRVFQAMRGCKWWKDGEPEHLPRFKSVHRYKSFTYRTVQGFSFEGDRIKLSKIGSMKFRGRKPPRGADPRMCTLKVDARGHWHAIVVYRIPDVKRAWVDVDGLPEAVGYDLGLRNLITSSEGEQIACPEFFKEHEAEIEKLQRRMEANEKGSPGWERARQRLAIIHQDIQLRRKGFFDRLAHDMTSGRMFIAMENLNVQAMKNKDCNSPRVRDKYTEASWWYLTTRVRFKAEGAGSELVLVSPQYTSRTCCRCGNVVQSLSLSSRVFHCDRCGMDMDRDRNAAINILEKGLGVETFRKAENGRPRRQHGCWSWTPSSVAHAGPTSPLMGMENAPSSSRLLRRTGRSQAASRAGGTGTRGVSLIGTMSPRT